MPRTTVGRYWRHLEPGHFDAETTDGRVVHLTKIAGDDWSLAIPDLPDATIVARYRDDAMLAAVNRHLLPRGIRLVARAER